MKPGLHSGIAMSEYLALPYVSAGLLNTVLTESPYHAKYELDHPTIDPTGVSDFGIAVHDALLEGVNKIEAINPEEYRSKPTKANPEGNVPKGWTNNAIKEARDAARAAGRIPMLLPDVQGVQDCVGAVHEQLANTEIAGCFETGAPEQTGVWTDGILSCRMRPDWLSKRWHISLKTTDGSAHPEPFIRWVFGPKGYDLSFAFYRRGLETLGIEVEHRLLVVQQVPPYRISIIGMSPARWEYATSRMERALLTWRRCVAANEWPAYDPRTHYAEPMNYEIAQEEAARVGMEYDEEQAKHGLQA